ncbi:MAG: hypothetical protein OEM00_02965 [Burkholderiaceae bacterium]|nr:hypothetical protein [Burkholderiaceae bacterium]MDH3459935.1 hypothetical protein [Burkholderiaceae bacterium]
MWVGEEQTKGDLPEVPVRWVERYLPPTPRLLRRAVNLSHASLRLYSLVRKQAALSSRIEGN